MSKAGESMIRGAREALAYARDDDGGCIAHVPDGVAHVPETVDVKAIRRHLGLSQARFAAAYGFTLDAVRNWEQGRRQPDTAARAFLLVIARRTGSRAAGLVHAP